MKTIKYYECEFCGMRSLDKDVVKECELSHPNWPPSALKIYDIDYMYDSLENQNVYPFSIFIQFPDGQIITYRYVGKMRNA